MRRFLAGLWLPLLVAAVVVTPASLRAQELQPGTYSSSVDHVVGVIINGGLDKPPVSEIDPVPVVPFWGARDDIDTVEHHLDEDDEHETEAAELRMAEVFKPFLKRAPSGKHPCKRGYHCPASIRRPVCCKGGTLCCAERCINSGKTPKCGLTDKQYRILEAKLRKEFDEQKKLMESEALRKNRIAELEKEAEEMKKRTAIEASQKQKETTDEQKMKRDKLVAEQDEKAMRKIQVDEEVVKKAALMDEQNQKQPSVPVPLADTATPRDGFAPPTLRVFHGVCYLGGSITIKNWKAGMVLASLPSECRPAATVIVTAVGEKGTISRLDIHADGSMIFTAGAQTGDWMTLNGISFVTATAKPAFVELTAPWTNYGNGFSTVGYVLSENMCHLQGVISLPKVSGNATDHWASNFWIGSLDIHCRPSKGALIFSANHHELVHRIDIRPDGRIVWSAGTVKYDWISLSGISFLVKDKEPLQLEKSFSAYGQSFAKPTVGIHDNHIVALSGVVQVNSATSTVMLQLPTRYVPTLRSSFGLNSGVQVHQFDVLTTGEIVYIDGPLGSGKRSQTTFWVSLDAIRFSVP